MVQFYILIGPFLLSIMCKRLGCKFVSRYETTISSVSKNIFVSLIIRSESLISLYYVQHLININFFLFFSLLFLVIS